MKMFKTAALAILGLSMGACAKDLAPPDETPTPGERIRHEAQADGSTISTINASENEVWVYLDLESRAEVMVDSPGSSAAWDLAFQRFKVKLNGGDSGAQMVEATKIEGVNFDAVTTAPSGGFTRDAPDGPDDGNIPDYALTYGASSETGPWGYNVETHQLSDSGVVWVVRSVEGGLYKFQFLDYYNDAGSPGHLTVRWAKLDEQLPPGVVEVRFPMRGYGYLNITSGEVTPTEPDTSLEWDLAFSGPAWQTNGGEGRIGKGGARLARAGSSFDDLTTAPTSGYTLDRLILYPGPPGSPRYVGNQALNEWYDYDEINHLAVPKDVVYLIRKADGGYAKMQILAYDEVNRTYRLKFGDLTRAPDVVRAELHAADLGAYTYFSLRENSLRSSNVPEQDKSWDLAFSRTRIQTNGGTSGSGRGGAHPGQSGALADLTEVPTSGYQVDVMLPDPESSGDEFSGNPVLANWFELTGTSTTPKDHSFVIRAPDGTYAKLRIDSYGDGHYVFDYVYAGPGQTSF
ncbi:MAG: HmuY family protein [Deltaproteobacteria bacterium]|nr:HmuY family protein [Deltaproteobacteria bacterium]